MAKVMDSEPALSNIISGKQLRSASSPTPSNELLSPSSTPATESWSSSINCTSETTASLRSTGPFSVCAEVPPSFDLIVTSDTHGVGCTGNAQKRTSDPFTAENIWNLQYVPGSKTAAQPPIESILSSDSRNREVRPRACNDAADTPAISGNQRESDDARGLLKEVQGIANHFQSSDCQYVQGPGASHAFPFAFGRSFEKTNESRCLSLRVGSQTVLEHVQEIFDSPQFPSFAGIETSNSPSHRGFSVSFADIRDTQKAYTYVQRWQPSWFVEYPVGEQSSSSSLSQIKPLSDQWKLYHEIQLMLSAESIMNPTQNEIFDLCTNLQEALQQYGQLRAFRAISNTGSRLTFKAEFCNAVAIENLSCRLNGICINGWTLTILGTPQCISAAQSCERKSNGATSDCDVLDLAFEGLNLGDMTSRENRPSFAASVSRFQDGLARSYTQRKEIEGQHTPRPLLGIGSRGLEGSWSNSPTSEDQNGYSSSAASPCALDRLDQARASPRTPRDHGLLFQDSRVTHQMNSRNVTELGTGNHNVVDLERIRRGEDVRTTIMLRNIPNKIDQAMLKDIIDETSLGMYDFMYLRIDFANNCNVGYAFINFEDPYHILDFVKVRAGHRWNRFNSDKVAEVSYATIQGRDCLIQKFRNSSVMLESPSFRPKLFHTMGHMVGKEEVFPAPDNPSKMRRSVENAEHVGLFAPRAGQNFRDAQRRNRSQYDRGTRLAEMDRTFPDARCNAPIFFNHQPSDFLNTSRSSFHSYGLT